MRTSLRARLRSPIHFWSKPLRAEPLAIFRMALGTIGLMSLLFSVAPRLPDDIGIDGYCPLDANIEWYDNNHRIDLTRGPMHLPLIENYIPERIKTYWQSHNEDRRFVGCLAAIWGVSLLAVILGFCTRFSCLIALLLAISFENRLTTVSNGGDGILRLGLFYLMISPCNAAWSIDRRIKRALAVRLLWRLPQEPPMIPAWSVRLAQIQLALLYLTTGLYKCEGDWFSGEAVYWMLNDLVITRVSYLEVPVPLWLCQWMSWATITFEVGFIVAVCLPYLRQLWLLGGVGFHLSILMTMEIGWFSPMMLAWYPLFLSGDSCCWIKQRLTRFMNWWR